MPVAIITLRPEPFYRREAFVTGLKRLGYAIELADAQRPSRDKTLPQPESRDDILALWNVKQGPQEAAARRWTALGGTVLVVENSYLAREEKSAYAISVGGHCGAGWFPVGGEDRFTPLGFALESRGAFNGHVLVCGQRGVGSSEMASPPQWGAKTARELSLRWPGVEVRHRPHPGVVKPRVSIEQDLEGASLCVIWSSACGVRALTMGVPVVYKAPHWVCADAAQTDLRLSPVAPLYDLKPALNTMAHGQWSVAEISAGEPFARMRAAGWGRSC